MTAERTVGGYRLLRVIGEGGMGVVHLALDGSDRAVAVKVVRPHVAADPETRARLAREVRSLLRVRHPRVAEVLDADFSAELPYVVMRYVPGEALDAAVRRDGPLTGAALDELAVGLFEAVAAVHAVGVVHRDLKPGNVLLLDGSPVVIDFGIARALDDVALTSTGLMVGTPGYLSPEVLDGTDVGTAADWWGWGAVVAFAATGRAPFRGGPLEAVWDRVRRGAADLDGVDERWARLLRATLLPDPAGRPTPEQLADEVTALTGRRPELPAAARALAEGTAAGAAGAAGAASAAASARDADRAARTRAQPRPQPARPAEPAVAPTSVQARPWDAPPDHGRAPGGSPEHAATQDPSRPPAARAVAPDPVTRVVRRPPPPAPAAPPAQAWSGAGPAASSATAPLATARPGTAPVAAAPAAASVQAPTAWPTAPLPAAPRADVPARAPWPASSPAYAVPSAPAAYPSAAHAPAASGPVQAHARGATGGPGAGGAVVQPRLPARGAPVPALPRRPGLALLGGVVVAAVAAAAPAGGGAVVLLWAALARSVQWSRVAAAITRARSGRLGAGARTGLTLMYPFRLLGALAATAAYLLVGALVVSPLLLVAAAVLLRDVSLTSWTSVQAVLLQDPVPAVLVVLGAFLAWVGPGGRAVRHGSRALTEPVARHRNGRLVLAGLAGLVVVSAVLVVTARL